MLPSSVIGHRAMSVAAQHRPAWRFRQEQRLPWAAKAEPKRKNRLGPARACLAQRNAPPVPSPRLAPSAKSNGTTGFLRVQYQIG